MVGMKQKTFRSSCNGFTLIELAIVLCVAAMLAGTLMPSFVKSVHIEAARKTASEMALLKEAAQQYFSNNAVWPDDLEKLRSSGYIDDRWGGKNPFGHLYVVTPEVGAVVVSTEVPVGMGSVVSASLPMAVYKEGAVSLRISSSGEGQGVPVGAFAAWSVPAVPDGWLLCDGRAVERAVYPALFAIIGITYGAGDGINTFNVPDFRGRVLVGLDNMGGNAANVISGAWAKTPGGKYGEETHKLIVSEMPSHRHYGYGENLPYWPYGTYGPNNTQGPPHADYDNYLLGTTPAGGDGAHNNIQPSMAVYWMIKT